MIKDIIKLRKDGLSFRKIATELNTTVGKVQYRWNKWAASEESKSIRESGLSEIEVENSLERMEQHSFVASKGELNTRLVTASKVVLFWDISAIANKVIQSYFNVRFTELVSVIRIYDVTDLIFDGTNAHHFYEITVPYQNGHWFVKGLAANRSFVAELGVLLPASGFFPLFRSNCVQTPKLELSGNLLSHDQLEMLRYEARPPKWKDHVSTYSYYGGEKDLEEKNG
ncbi:DUF4912 domain-containing protein [Neobacillus kokaensis]|uniref:DUF4912 domain-containing protein n=1 Tax=Neobacillus kokaensis TaxID=2759023 RepID=A0ABQ3N397_9BACI|nr:DUF4912 domain-containing protein [Neobacillus kokaensis]GHH97000.1 hypothetical protein AM1BK_05430 [Neobacillus kokaensis]